MAEKGQSNASCTRARWSRGSGMGQRALGLGQPTCRCPAWEEAAVGLLAAGMAEPWRHCLHFGIEQRAMTRLQESCYVQGFHLLWFDAAE